MADIYWNGTIILTIYRQRLGLSDSEAREQIALNFDQSCRDLGAESENLAYLFGKTDTQHDAHEFLTELINFYCHNSFDG